MPLEVPPLDARGRQLKQAFEARRGYWTPWLEGMLSLSPDFFEAFLAFTGTPWTTGPLPARTKELVYIAIDSTVTHLYRRGIEMHVREALRHGATPAQVMAVLKLASLAGTLATTTAAPLLLQALGPGQPSSPLPCESIAAKDDFIAATGHWDEGLEALLRLDLAAFRDHARMVRSAWLDPALDPVTRELVGVAIHASSTLLHGPGIQLHLQRALACGATPAQLMEVLQLTSVIGIHTCSVAVPMLVEAMGRLPPSTS
jgi:alkylhydroperoxidase/carboxymuconolactone decarboxylase family protein YurZ